MTVNDNTNQMQSFFDIAGIDKPSDDIMSTCVRCGLCLQSCPTYVKIGAEPSSPRGRIALIRGVADGRLPVTSEGFLHQMGECLGCLACEDVCPSGVDYGHLVEAGRAQARLAAPRKGIPALLDHIVFNYLFRSMFLFRLFATSLWLYQKSGLQWLARTTGILKLLRQDKLEQFLPEINNKFVAAQNQKYLPKVPSHVTRSSVEPTYKRVALLTGCVQSVAFADVHEATIHALQVNGCEVVLPEGQGCCGALHAHAGELIGSKEIARQNINALMAINPDYIVANAAGCSHHLKDYAHMLHDDPAYAEKAAHFTSITRDITELLAELGPKPPRNPLPWKVTYQEPCHLVHGQKIKSQPRQVLAAIPGLELTEMADSDRCCGSAGTYNVLQPDLSQAFLDDKMDSALATGADIIASANTGCMIQVRTGLAQRKAAPKVLHIVEILDAAYRNDEKAKA